MNYFIKAISNYRVIIALVVLLAISASFQSYFQKNKAFADSTKQYTQYNNYIIFKQSFTHLTENKDLYILYPEEHWDFYKYSPSFAAFFGIFAIFPDLIGLNLWNLFNAMILLLSVYYLPKLNKMQKGLILTISLIELMTSLQNEQSNALIAGLTILTLGLLERRNYLAATFCVVFSMFIKVFGIVGLALLIFYPKKWKLALYTLGWSLVLFILPLIIIDFSQLKFLYTSWSHLLANDLSESYGFSVMGWLQSWFGIGNNKTFTVITGVILFLIPLARIRLYNNYIFRLLTLSSVLIWVVIFNPKAESPTFIIAMSGVALWFVISDKNPLNIILFASAFILTSLSPTDLFPRFLRDEFVTPYSLKVVPCILVWVKVIYDMIVMKKGETEEELYDLNIDQIDDDNKRLNH
jgi:hypothetical protein